MREADQRQGFCVAGMGWAPVKAGRASKQERQLGGLEGGMRLFCGDGKPQRWPETIAVAPVSHGRFLSNWLQENKKDGFGRE